MAEQPNLIKPIKRFIRLVLVDIDILVMSSTEKLITSLEVIYDVLTALDKIGYLTDNQWRPKVA
jgi:hypothetical protein